MTQTEYMLDLLDQTTFATGADFSRHKGLWDLSKVDMDLFQSVMDFVVLRAGYGAQNGGVYKDDKFDYNYSIVEKMPHILRGVYWYFSSHSSVEAQFNAFMLFLEGKEFDFYVLDFEKYYNEQTAGFAIGAVTFLNKLEKQFPGKRILVYANRYDYQDWLKRYTNGADRFPLWIAQYPWKNWMSNFTEYFKSWWNSLIISLTKRPTLPAGLPADHWEIWQMVDASGIGNELGFQSDELDFNISRRPKDAFIEWIGEPSRWETTEPTPPPKKLPEPYPTKTYAEGVRDTAAAVREVLEKLEAAE